MQLTMRYPTLLILFLAGFLTVAKAQQINTVFLSKEDKTRNRFIVVSPPDSVATTGFMYLIPGMFEQPEEVLRQTKLPEMAAQKGLLVFIPVLEPGVEAFGVDDSTQVSLQKMLDYTVKQYHLVGKNFYLGGFSIGGSCAVKYAELAVKNNYPIKPSALFAVDPPLDFARYYQTAQHSIRLRERMQANQEQLYMTARLRKKMNGTPATARENYIKYSPYSYDDMAQSAVKQLREMPFTIYTEPDIDWWMQARGFDYFNLNCVDAAAMINELHLLGNAAARLVATTDKGYRNPDHRRHPHSWSILDPEELLTWLEHSRKQQPCGACRQ